ncbi:BON domain-containing protein [Noviherbaspirillum sp.]|uniref:BON domain-containing protein n=1 Tax=Noviherbaspirillum sp. TaxID=1926288 RepID=UPI002FE038AA
MMYLPTIGSIIVAGALVACAPTQTSRGTGQVLDDVTVTAKVKTEIAQTQGIGDAAQINVDTYRGVVSLAGFVDNERQAQIAMQAARRVPGVEKVQNNLQVKPAK